MSRKNHSRVNRYLTLMKFPARSTIDCINYCSVLFNPDCIYRDVQPNSFDCENRPRD